MFRRFLANINKLIIKGLLALIRSYQYLLSPWIGQQCRFYPSCSSYSACALQRFGVVYGVYLSVKRLMRCHPWQAGGVDPVPKKE